MRRNRNAADRFGRRPGSSRLRRGLLLATVGCGLLPAQASAVIQIDRGIAGARLDNTRTEVRAALGQPASTRTGTNDFGDYLIYRYAGGIRVFFQGRAGNPPRRVTSVETTGLGDRTPRGVGVRSRERAVRRGVPGVRCATDGGVRICSTGESLPGQRQTDFFIRQGRVVRVVVARVID